MGKSKSKLATAYRSAFHSSVSTLLKAISVAGMLMLFSFSAKAVELGAQAPDFKLQTLSGQQFQLSDYQGKKPVYLVFWATWCPICKAEIPNFKKLHAQLGDKVEILAINVGFQDTLEKAKSYTIEQELPYSVAFDENTVITKNYGVIGTPWQVVIDINGKVRYFSNHTPENFESHLEELIKKI
jgi:peroxiredoxin